MVGPNDSLGVSIETTGGDAPRSTLTVGSVLRRFAFSIAATVAGATNRFCGSTGTDGVARSAALVLAVKPRTPSSVAFSAPSSFQSFLISPAIACSASPGADDAEQAI